MSAEHGYYSWVCYIDVQKGAWFGPIEQSEIEQYENGFALDDNIKSWTEFGDYSDKPTETLTCNFNKRIPLGHQVKTVACGEVGSLVPDNATACTEGDARKVVENGVCYCQVCCNGQWVFIQRSTGTLVKCGEGNQLYLCNEYRILSCPPGLPE